MAECNPLPDCLAHLAQRDDAVLETVLDEINRLPGNPLGKLTGDIYRLWRNAKSANDQRLIEIAHWMHERVCAARYEIEGCPFDRPMPQMPEPVR